MSNLNRTTLYVGVTNNIKRRTLEHKAGIGSGFTARYQLFNLLYCEEIHGMEKARAREKQLKNWHKKWKWNLIKSDNPDLHDLAFNWFSPKEIEDEKNLSRYSHC